VRGAAARLKKRPKVYFEEWDEPMISGIRWVERADRSFWWRGHLCRAVAFAGATGRIVRPEAVVKESLT